MHFQSSRLASEAVLLENRCRYRCIIQSDNVAEVGGMPESRVHLYCASHPLRPVYGPAQGARREYSSMTYVAEAQQLISGIYHQPKWGLGKFEAEIRRRIWWSLVVADKGHSVA